MTNIEKWSVATLGVVMIAAGTVALKNKPVHGQQATTGLPAQELFGVAAPTLPCSATQNLYIPYVQVSADSNPLGYTITRYACLPVGGGAYAWAMGAVYPVPVSAVIGLAPVATSGAYGSLTGLPTIPTNTSQLTNNSGFLSNANAITGSITIPATLLSFGNVTVTPTSAVALPGTFWTCAMATSNASAQAAVEISGNVITSGTLNVVAKNGSLSTLTGGYSINYKCNQQ